MGVIKDGTVSGFLPSAETFCVNFPGYPSSSSRAMETLGGSEGILKVRSSSSNQLEFRFRPEDPYCHPALGQLRRCENNFLLKLSKVKKETADSSVRKVQDDKSSQTTSQLENHSATAASTCTKEDQTHLCADIVARASEAYVFEGMADYQHVVAVHAGNSRRKKRSRTEVEKRQFEKGGLMDMDNEDIMLLVPPLFSTKDAPTNLVLSRPPVPSNLKRKPDGTFEDFSQVLTENRFQLDFRDKEIPNKVSWEERIPQGSDDWVRQMAVSKLFEERPIWPKKALVERLLDLGLGFSDALFNRSSRFLVNIAYYFNNGPFPRFWIRKGYDPREDPDSRLYQGIDFRIPQQLQDLGNRAATNEVKQRWGDICAFRVFPDKYHVTLQLYELEDDYIQEEIKNSPVQQTCTLKSGWFTDHMLDSFRQRAMVRFLSIYPKPGVEGLLKQASERFEKSKRMRFLVSSPKVDKQKDQKATEDNEGRNENQEKNDVGDTDDEEEEEEMEDNDEEDADAFDGLYPAAEEGDISLQPYHPDMENISRTHLQGLFGDFVSVEAHGDQERDGDETDPEFEIYGQDIDDGDFDDYED